MPHVSGMLDMFRVMNPMPRRKLSFSFNYLYLIRTARNLSAAVSALHNVGYVVGDFNQKNVLVNGKALVTLIDTDSFQVTDPATGEIHRCTVGTADYTPPEAVGHRYEEIDRAKVIEPTNVAFGRDVVWSAPAFANRRVYLRIHGGRV